MDGRNRTYAGSSEFGKSSIDFVQTSNPLRKANNMFSAEALLLAVDKATSNTLFQPDWEVNRVCVEGMNLIGKPEV